MLIFSFYAKIDREGCDNMLCPKCGTENPEGSIMCNGCGYIIDTSGPLSEIDQHVEEASNGRVKYIIKKKKKPADITPTFDAFKPKIEGKKDNGISVGVNRNRYFSNDSTSGSPVDIREALTRNERKTPYVQNTEYINRFINELPKEDVPNPEEIIASPSDKKATIVIICLLAVAIIITIAISMKIKNMDIYLNAKEGFERMIGDTPLVNALPFLLYVGLIFGLSYDSYKAKDFTMKKNIRKNVLESLGVTFISLIVFDGFSALSIGDTYFELMLRFFIFLAILSGNNYLKKSYNPIENKLGIRNILFEFLIYYNLFSIILFIFF